MSELDGDTTTPRKLIPLAAGAVLLDTPEMRELSLWADPEFVGQHTDRGYGRRGNIATRQV